MDHCPPRPTCRDDFEIAIITALPLEYEAVTDIFDGFWNDDGDPYGKSKGDQNTYTTGWIGQHNVVLVICSDIGKVNASSAATSCSMSFPHVKLAFLVGVCGVAPQTSNGDELLLGDVVVSDQIVACDFGRRYADGIKLKCHPSYKTSATSHAIHRFMKIMQIDHYRELLPRRAMEHLKVIQDNYHDKYKSPQRIEDKLFLPEYRHKHQLPGVCQICYECTTTSEPVCDSALTSTCQELGCDESQLILRQRLAEDRIQQNPIVHWGTFASADTVLKSAQDRDQIARDYGVIGFEMEATGACDVFPCVVIKAACDYADSHKNKKWQKYAAVMAACVMKALLQWYPSTDRQIKPSDLNALLRLEREIPPRIYHNDLVTVNDALGGTYNFNLSFIDSWEV
jgi:nucleoside phosphorylase